jgi:PGM1 C-terminal domain/ATP-grasp domain
VTQSEQELGLALGVPVFGADPRHAHYGTKSGCRELFARTGVPHPLGAEGVTGIESAVDAILRLRAIKPEVSRLVMKLNHGVAGEGNALVDLGGVPAAGSPDERAAVAERVQALTPECPGLSASAFSGKLAAKGGIVEEWIAGRELRSPSVQLQITPDGAVHVVSTHDQILGGSTGQSYLGCRFPAAPAYATRISREARKVGDELARSGVIGRLAIDFVVTREEGGQWQPFAIEINLRKGGTTHPFETLARLTGGAYDVGMASFRTPTAQAKHYVATDHKEAPELRGLCRDGVLALARRPDLRFDPLRRMGVVFHMLSSLDELGRTGFTAIADNADEAAARFQHAEVTLLEAACAEQRVEPALAA